jgi:hypothetical protein
MTSTGVGGRGSDGGEVTMAVSRIKIYKNGLEQVRHLTHLSILSKLPELHLAQSQCCMNSK